MRSRIQLCCAMILVVAMRLLNSQVMLHTVDAMFGLLALANLIALSTMLSNNQAVNQHPSVIARINSLLAYHLFATLAYMIVSAFHSVPFVCGKCCDRADHVTRPSAVQTGGKRVLFALAIAAHSVMIVPRCLALLAICTLMAGLRWKREDPSVPQPIDSTQDMELTFFFASSLLLFCHGCVLMCIDCKLMKQAVTDMITHTSSLDNQTPVMMISQPINQLGSEIALSARESLSGELIVYDNHPPVVINMSEQDKSLSRCNSALDVPLHDIIKSPSHTHRSVHEQCVVCLVAYQPGDTLRKLPCFHLFHDDCIQTWLRTSRACPTCRSPAHRSFAPRPPSIST